MIKDLSFELLNQYKTINNLKNYITKYSFARLHGKKKYRVLFSKLILNCLLYNSILLISFLVIVSVRTLEHVTKNLRSAVKCLSLISDEKHLKKSFLLNDLHDYRFIE